LNLEARLLRCWYEGRGGCLLLLPLSWLFAALAALRRAWHTWRGPARLPVPVIVVGNITVGGTGKTPLVLWLVERLRAAGRRPGVISRGYGGAAGVPVEVRPDSAPAVAGDEPLLVARRGLCPVWIGRRRHAAGLALLAAHPEVDVIVSDDGLQHYALARDIELAVVDGRRGFGNGRRLPAGPLREPVARLAEVDAVVINGEGGIPAPGVPVYPMRLVAGGLYNLARPSWHEPASYFVGQRAHAVAAIGNPARFFALLDQLGITAAAHAFPDHHPFRADDLPAGTVIMTEKDAVKCAAFGREDLWVLPVDAEVSEGLEQQILAKLETRHG
jgi:tetraacyldisaccharide 4'-kinase